MGIKNKHSRLCLNSKPFKSSPLDFTIDSKYPFVKYVGLHQRRLCDPATSSQHERKATVPSTTPSRLDGPSSTPFLERTSSSERSPTSTAIRSITSASRRAAEEEESWLGSC